MKKQLLFLILSVFTSALFAQNFLFPTSKWHYVNNGGMHAPNTQLKTFTYVKDTLVLGKTSQLLSNGHVFYSSNDSVFYYDPGYANFGLLYDFNAVKGDTIESQIPSSMQLPYMTFKSVVTDINYEVFPSGDSLRKFELGSLNDSVLFKGQCYYERIGALEFLPVPTLSILEYDVIKCYSDSTIDAQITYLQYSCDSLALGIEDLSFEKPWHGIQPNPVIDEIELLNFSGSGKSYVIYSIEGKQVKSGSLRYNQIQGLSKLQAGIYFLQVFSENTNEINNFRFVKE